ncbi:hypothetical protein OS493_022604 [Desmophyllum pertusum]|uniref:Uncharacterized protein n=1 Tax=Desmophyllum pertusum TaxID=174260 RepID=A0A9W9YYD3_9CNID|nr:hypothetical protein OS493_022604 [Desmophyllum pertusum]
MTHLPPAPDSLMRIVRCKLLIRLQHVKMYLPQAQPRVFSSMWPVQRIWVYKLFCHTASGRRQPTLKIRHSKFTGMESKNFSLNFAFLIQEVLSMSRLSQGSVLKLHALAFVGLKLRDSASIYSRVEESKAQVDDAKTLCQDYFKANVLFLNGVNPTVWTLGYAIPHYTKQLFEELGYGLGLNSMQGRDAKHVKLATYVKNTCNMELELEFSGINNFKQRIKSQFINYYYQMKLYKCKRQHC